MRFKRGFTLIEMLVVLAIIAVLAAILFPVMSKARMKARQATCISNLKQLLTAVNLYTQDYDRTLVPARAGKAPDSLGYSWCMILQPYMKNEKILICPLDPQGQLASRTTDLPHSYGINYDLTFNASGWSRAPLAYSLSHIEGVSEKILFFDMKPAAQAMGASYRANRLSRVDARHFDRAAFGFLDGHAKCMPPTATNAPKNMWMP